MSMCATFLPVCAITFSFGMRSRCAWVNGARCWISTRPSACSMPAGSFAGSLMVSVHTVTSCPASFDQAASFGVADW